MKIRPFKELIGMSKEKLNEAMAPIRARKVKATAQLEASKLDEQILTLETEVQEECAREDINLPRIIDKIDKIALLERRKVKYGELLEQLFPTE
jgi:hypothetical protein